MAHTPGPWIADDFEIRNESGDLVAEVNYILDAHLIAAAPELLAAARLAVLNFKRQNLSTANADFLGDDDHEAWNALENAIAKAEGRNAAHE